MNTSGNDGSSSPQHINTAFADEHNLAQQVINVFLLMSTPLTLNDRLHHYHWTIDMFIHLLPLEQEPKVTIMGI